MLIAAAYFVVAANAANANAKAAQAQAPAHAGGGGDSGFSSVEIPGFPHVKQKEDFCGEADVEMAMRRLKYDVNQDDVFALAKVDPAKARGAVTNDLATALRALGIEPGKVWYHDSADKQFAELHKDLVAGVPSIVCMHYSDEPQTTEHFRLVTGYDGKTDEVIYQEPAEDNGSNRRMKRALFEKLWTFRPAKDRVSLIRFRVPAPSSPPSITRPIGPSESDAVQHIMAMNAPKGFTVVWEKPFVVVGDESPEEVRKRAKGIVAWTRDLLMKDFFDEAPSNIQEVWILKDAPSYLKVSKERFKQTPDTPYGYYLAGPRALIMNIKPGYGTLTHELTHPFFEHAYSGKNNGDAPAWLNEGVASLFERPAERDGHLIGKVNWRLPALLTGLKNDTIPTFDELVHMDDTHFYEDDRGTNYAQARYLCYWLQEKGLLAKMVKRAQELQDEDHSGWKALTEVLGKDPDAFRAEWTKFVKGLAATS